MNLYWRASDYERMNHSGYSSGRIRSRSKQPIYTSDKRAKFTQRENKKWIRLLTVIGYVVFVSAPAISLSVYYINFWDPDYINKFPLNSSPLNGSVHIAQLQDRSGRDLSSVTVPSTEKEEKCQCSNKDQIEKTTAESLDLGNILKQKGIFLTTPPPISSESELLSSSSESSSSEASSSSQVS